MILKRIIILTLLLFIIICIPKNIQSDDVINLLLQEAYDKVDSRYIYGHTGPNSFDCSGFTYYLYDKYFDIQLLRSAKDQGYDSTYTKIKTIEELEPGDCVYFNTDSNDNDLSDHAGLYYGDGLVIHASSSKKKVIITDLYEENSYYARVFSWGRRIVATDYNLIILQPEKNIIIEMENRDGP